MRTLGEFIDARVIHAGFRSKHAFSAVTGVGRPTFDKLIEAEAPQDVSAQRRTLETVAVELKFQDWADLVDAWRTSDLDRGLDRTMWGRLRRAVDEVATAERISPAEVAERLVEEVTREEGSRPLGSTGLPPGPPVVPPKPDDSLGGQHGGDSPGRRRGRPR